MTNDSTIVRGTGLVKRWGDTVALKGVDVEIGKGVTGLLGANGAGKTTLIGLILGLHRPDAGAIEVLGHDPAAADPGTRLRIGYAPEHEALPPTMHAFDLVRHIAELHGIPRREAPARASDALYEVGLGEERYRAVQTMSTGQRQRVKIAQAIVHDPALVVLDEPTNGLDPLQRNEMVALIDRVGHRLGLDVILSSHLLEEVERVSDSVVILDAGTSVTSGTMAEVRRPDTEELEIDIEGTADDAERLVARLAKKKVTAVATNTRLLVAMDGAESDLDVIRDAIADLGLGLRRLERRRQSLEDVFMRAGVES